MVHVAGKEIGLDIDPCPFFIGSEEGLSHRDRDDRETERLVHHFIDGEAHPVDRNGAFWGDEGDELRIDTDDDIVAVAVIGDGRDRSDRIDMPLNDVPFKPLSHGHGRFDVDVPLELFGCDMSKGLRREFDAEPVTFDGDNREAGTVDRD